MKTYQELKNGYLLDLANPSAQFPQVDFCREYRNALKEVSEGTAIIQAYIDPGITWDDVRGQRNLLLSHTDWTTSSDAPLANKQAWLDYRQALRNIPQDFSDPNNVIWPQKP